MPQYGGSECLWAMHLEVFVPKPNDRSKEKALTRWLDSVLEEDTVPMRPRSAEEQQYLSPAHRVLLSQARQWESTMYGYSVYSTDGFFMQLAADGSRQPDRCTRESTLVLKFIVTNYRSRIEANPGRSLLVSAQGDQTQERPSDWWCMHYHYLDTCDFLVENIAEMVLTGEAEVWSQTWYAALKRQSPNRPPVTSTRDERLQFASRQIEPVVCVFDYVPTEFE